MESCRHPVRTDDCSDRVGLYCARVDDSEICNASLHVDNKADQLAIVLRGIDIAWHKNKLARETTGPEVMPLASTGLHILLENMCRAADVRLKGLG
jgi:hypothetical protein